MTLSRARVPLAVTVLVLAAGTGAARAASYSFASDDDSGAFTLRGTTIGNAFTIVQGRSPATPVTLKLDDDNMTQPTISVAAGLVVNLTATYSGSIGVGEQTHVYGVTGSFSFLRAGDNFPLLVVQVNGGSSLTISGTSTTWNSAGSIAGSDAAGGPSAVDYTDFGMQEHLSGLGIAPGAYGMSFTNIMEDFSFTMTMVNASDGPVGLDAGHLPTGAWEAEASFSGHAVGVPAPAAGTGLAVLALASRRRRR